MGKSIGFLLLIFFVGAAPSTQPAPTSDYDQFQLEGFSIYLNRDIAAADSKLANDVKEQLRVRLFEMKCALPPKAMDRLMHVPIWIELHDRGFPGMCYHPSRDWLRDNGYNPDKAGAVEIGDARHFLTWSKEQPMMVLHEFSHAYHHQVLGYDYAPIRTAYQHAKEKHLYDSVLRANGHYERAYCMNNDQEYFAEQSEAFFGTNDFYPFVRAELIERDPEMADVVRKAWGIDK
jgi:hypothetical protein